MRIDLYPRHSLLTRHAAPVRQHCQADWVAAAAEAFDGTGRLAPRRLQVARGSVGLHAVAPSVVQAQQTVVRQLHVEIRAGHDDAGDVPFLVLLANATGELAGFVVTQHDPVAGIRHEDVVLADRQAGKPSPLAGRFPGGQTLALRVEHFHVITCAGINGPITGDRHTARRGAEVNVADAGAVSGEHAYCIARGDIHAVLGADDDTARVGAGAAEMGNLLVMNQFWVGLAQPLHVIGEGVGVLAGAGAAGESNRRGEGAAAHSNYAGTSRGFLEEIAAGDALLLLLHIKLSPSLAWRRAPGAGHTPRRPRNCCKCLGLHNAAQAGRAVARPARSPLRPEPADHSAPWRGRTPADSQPLRAKSA